MYKVSNILNIMSQSLDKSNEKHNDLKIIINNLAKKLNDKYKKKTQQIKELKNEIRSLKSLNNSIYDIQDSSNPILESEKNYDMHPDKFKEDHLDKIGKIVNDLWVNDKLYKRCSYGNSDLSLYKEGTMKRDGVVTIKTSDRTPEQEQIDCDYLHKCNSSMEDKMKLNSCATDWITIHFFDNKKDRIRYINLVIETYSKVLDTIIGLDTSFDKNNINIISKGGVAIRLMLKNLTRDFQSEIMDDIDDTIKKQVKLSDFDFEILTNKEVFNDEKIINKINVITYIVILQIKYYMIQHKDHYFAFFRYNEKQQNKQIKKLETCINNKLKDTTLFKDYNVQKIDYESNDRKCFAIVKNETEDSNLSGDNFSLIYIDKFLDNYNINFNKDIYKDLGNENNFYATHNTLIDFETKLSDKNIISSFNLNRIKFNFKVTIKKEGTNTPQNINIPGEILDLSHPSKKDRRSFMELEPFTNNKYFSEYIFSDSNLRYLSYSIYGLLKDINDIIFPETEYAPWNNNKYKKRLTRSIALFIYLLFLEKSLDISYLDRISLLDNLNNEIKTDFQDSNNSIYKIQSDFWIEMIFHLKKVAEISIRDSSQYLKYKRILSKTIEGFILNLKKKWNLSRNPFLTNTEINTDLFNISFYDIYQL